MIQKIFTVEMKLAMKVPNHLSSIDEEMVRDILNGYCMQSDDIVDWKIIEESIKFKTIDSFTYDENEAFNEDIQIKHNNLLPFQK